MKTHSFLLLSVLLPAGLRAAAPAPRASAMPFFFLENRGLTDPRAHYFLKRPELSAWFMEQEIVLAMRGHRISMRFAGANGSARIEGAEHMDGHASFFIGDDANRWVKDLPMEGAVAYRELWPGIDMVYAGNGRTLKSEFRVAPGGDPSRIRWTYSTPFRAAQSRDGSLSVSGEGLDLREDAPVIYQENHGARVAVNGKFHVFADGSVGFDLDNYDHALPLVIDPTMTFSTYVGGNGQDEATSVALDPNGNAYLAGWTDSNNFAQTGPAKLRPYAGGMDAFIAKFSALGDKLIYCTYLGGSGDDRAFGLAVDTAGTAYLTGYTTSTNFPVSSGIVQKSLAGKRNAFVTHLNASGNGLLYSTFLGGENTDTAYGISIDSTGRAFITGDTNSAKFPVTSGAFQSVNKGGEDAFAAGISANGASLVFSTYLGGSSTEHAAAVVVNSAGTVLITGSTQSMDFPTASAMQNTSGGNQDAFVTGIAAGGKTLVFSTYLGGSGGTVGLAEEGDSIALDPWGEILVAGTTSSTNFPVTAGSLQQSFAGGNTDGFLSKLDPTGKTLVYSTYVGGSSVEHVTGVGSDPRGYVFVSGYTESQDFPNIRAPQTSNHGAYDGFLYKLNPSGNMLVFATYLGGSDADAITGMAVDSFGGVVLSGYTSSGDFPIAGVLGSAQKYKYGTITAFLSKVSSGWMPAVVDTVSSALNFTVDQAHDRGTDGVSSTSMKASFGLPGDLPVFGDWNGSGTPKLGFVRGNVWYLDYNGNGVWDGPSGGDRQFTFPIAGTPVVGDWNGSGTLKAGCFSGGYWVVDLSGMIQGVNNGQGTKSFYFGGPGDLPIIGDWTGNGISKIGIVRSGVWFLDINGDYSFDTTHDRLFNFGASTDKPVTGDWDGSGVTRPGVYRNGTWFLSFDSMPAPGVYFSSPSNVWSFTFGGSASVPLVSK